MKSFVVAEGPIRNSKVTKLLAFSVVSTLWRGNGSLDDFLDGLFSPIDTVLRIRSNQTMERLVLVIVSTDSPMAAAVALHSCRL